MPARRHSVSQLDFERRALRARLAFSGGDQERADCLMRQIEDCDLSLAATPAQSIVDLLIKIDILAETLAPDLNDASSLESVFLKMICDDAARLAAEECDSAD